MPASKVRKKGTLPTNWGDPNGRKRNGRYWGMPLGPGVCHWCRHEREETFVHIDLVLSSCHPSEQAACNQRRIKHLTLAGARPASFFKALEEGDADAIRECKRAGIDVVELLVARSVDKQTAEKYNATVGLPPDTEPKEDA